MEEIKRAFPDEYSHVEKVLNGKKTIINTNYKPSIRKLINVNLKDSK